MKIGLFGGTFDPPHNAHIAVAQKALCEYSLDRIIFIPAGDPPHKKDKEKTDKRIRLKMIEFALTGFDFFCVSDYEINLQKPSYSVNTVKFFKEKYPKDELYFIIGGDSFRDIPTWYNYREMLTLCSLIVLARPDTPKNKLLELFDGDEKPPRVFYSDSLYMDVSSTDIRKKIACGEDVSNLVPAKVLDVITKENLYKEITDGTSRDSN